MRIVTSFNRTLWNKYAKHCFPSIASCTDQPITVWYDGQEQISADWKVREDIQFQRLNDYQEFNDFARRHKGKDNQRLAYKYVRFWPKSFAITETARQINNEWLVWVDADVKATKKITDKEWDAWLQDCDVAYLPRGRIGYCESGFIAFNLKRKPIIDLLKELRFVYTSETLFKRFAQWHDAYIIDRLIKKYGNNIKKNSLSLNTDSSSIFRHSELKNHLEHYKGPKKLGNSSNADSRNLALE